MVIKVRHHDHLSTNKKNYILLKHWFRHFIDFKNYSTLAYINKIGTTKCNWNTKSLKCFAFNINYTEII